MTQQTTANEFAAAARTVNRAARSLGLKTASFRSPPRTDAHRSIRRLDGGGVVLAVAIKNRPLEDVAADLIDGVLIANDVTGSERETARQLMWAQIMEDRA